MNYVVMVIISLGFLIIPFSGVAFLMIQYVFKVDLLAKIKKLTSK